VDDEAFVRDLLVRGLAGQGYVCDQCSSGEEALGLLGRLGYDLMLADLMMPGMEGMTLMREALRICPDLAVILVTGVADISVAVDSMKRGAFDYVTKPFRLHDITISVNRALQRRRLCIQNRLYRQSLEEQVSERTAQLRETLDILQETYQSTLEALGTALDSREIGSAGHSLRVRVYAAAIARELGLHAEQARALEQAALLHDIGKIGVPDDLLNKPGKLTESEWVLMRRHPEIGYRILSEIKVLQPASLIVLQHQERYDGSGYPGGLCGEEILLGARILSVADTFECLTIDRPFQQAVSADEAQEILMRLAGSQLDPWIVDAFLRIPLSERRAPQWETGSRPSPPIADWLLHESLED